MAILSMTLKVASKPKRRDWAALDRQHQRRGTLAFTLLLNPEVLTPPVRKVGRGATPIPSLKRS